MQADEYNVYILVPFPFYKKWISTHKPRGGGTSMRWESRHQDRMRWESRRRGACAGYPASGPHAQSGVGRTFVHGLRSKRLGEEFEENLPQLWWEPQRMDNDPFPFKNVSLGRVLWHQEEFNEISLCMGEKKSTFFKWRNSTSEGCGEALSISNQPKAQVALGREDDVHLRRVRNSICVSFSFLLGARTRLII